MEGIKTLQLDGVFAKGVVINKGSYNVPLPYAIDARNIRLVNGSTTIRPGFQLRGKDLSHNNKTIRGITSGSTGVYVTHNSKFKKVDLVTNAYSDVGGAPTLSGDYDVSYVRFGRYIIILTGLGYPYVFNELTNSMSQLGVGNIDVNAVPRFGDVFTNYTFLAGGGDNKDKLYYSRPIQSDHPEYSYDRASSPAGNITLKSNIESIKASQSRLFVFTETSLEYVDQSSFAQVGDVGAFYTKPLAGENIPASNDSVVVFDDAVFYLTKQGKIKSVNFVPGKTEPEIGEISDKPGLTNQGLFDLVNEDLSSAHGYRIDIPGSKLVVWSMRGKNSQVNNIHIIYDINEDTILIDDNKFFKGATSYNGKVYVGSHINSFVWEDEVGHDDDGQPVSWKRRIKPFEVAPSNKKKQYREWGMVGEIGNTEVIKVEADMDGRNEFTGYITGSAVKPVGLGSVPIAMKPTAGESTAFVMERIHKGISKGNLRAKGYALGLTLSGSSYTGGVVLSAAEIGVRAIDSTKLGDIIQPSNDL